MTDDDLLADLIARCPEHGTATGTWPECRCAAARKAAAAMAADQTPDAAPVPDAALRCPACGHDTHAPGAECETPVHHGPSRMHLCLCLNRPGASRSCPPQMNCQGGPLGYADIWCLQRGQSVVGADGKVITPDVLAPAPGDGPHTACRGCETCDLATQLADERAAHEEHRRWLAALFDLPTNSDWLAVTRGVTEARRQETADPDMVQRAGALRRTTAELSARADGLDLRVNQVVTEHEEHRAAVCEALGCFPSTSWPDLIEIARERVAQLSRQTGDAEDRVREAEGACTAAVRDRKAAEQRAVDARYELEGETKRADRAEATIARVRVSLRLLGPLARSHVERALDDPSEPARTAPAETGCVAHGGPDCVCDPETGADEADLTALTVPVSPREDGRAHEGHPVQALHRALAGPPVATEHAIDLISRYYDAITSGPPAGDPVTVAVELPLSAVRALVDATGRALEPCGSTSTGTDGVNGWTTSGPCELPAGHTGYCKGDGWRWHR